MAAPQLSTLADAYAGGDELPAIAVTGDGGAKLSRKQLRDSVESFAHRLTAAGIAPGDVVSVAMANTVIRLCVGWPGCVGEESEAKSTTHTRHDPRDCVWLCLLQHSATLQKPHNRSSS